MAILVNSGRTARASALLSKSFYMAWGNGLSAWDTTPVDPIITDTALVAEVGRRRVSLAGFCTPDNSGNIIVPNGTFTLSGTPTKNIYLRFNFDFTDGVGESIREIGVFSDCSVVGGLPSGQFYFTPNQVSSPGFLMVLDHIPKITRTSSVRQVFEFVITV